MVGDEKNGCVVTVGPASGEKCQRCWNFSESVDVHAYWPTWRICKRCVDALLEMRTPPFIARTGNDFYVCRDEREWWEIKLGRIPLPKDGNTESGQDGNAAVC